MASNLENHVGENIQSPSRFRFPQTPAEIELERSVSHAYHDVNEVIESIPKLQRKKNFPLKIYYSKKDGEDTLRVRIKTSQGKDLYSSQYMPVFKAYDFSLKLSRFLENNKYSYERTREIVKED